MIPADWPFRDRSRHLRVRPHDWHVQQMGDGPDLLMLHGAGGATHSWAPLVPHLTGHRLTLVDLPGHGFTRLGTHRRSGLDPMAEDVTALCDALGLAPRALVGHSAGAALALRVAQDRPAPVVAINGAFQMFDGMAGWLFPVMAKALALNPLTPLLFTAGGTQARTRRLIEGTGSRIRPEGLARYHRLISDRRHVDGALTMMANWSLEALHRAAPGINVPVLLLSGTGDRAVPPRVSREMAGRLPRATHIGMEGGHLLHEERPEAVAGAIAEFLAG